MAWRWIHQQLSYRYFSVLCWLCMSSNLEELRGLLRNWEWICRSGAKVYNDNEDDWAGDDSFIYEESVSHQRIEAWRSILGKYCTILPYKPLYGLFFASNFAFLSLGHPLEYASLQFFYDTSLNNLHTGFVSGLLVLKKSLLTRAL